jgi:excisionase family DNA binding protein
MDSIIVIPFGTEELRSLIRGELEKFFAEHATGNRGPENDICTVKEAASLLKVTPPSLYGLVHRKEIPHFKKGRRLYFSKHELVEWVRAGRQVDGREISLLADAHIQFLKERRR